MANIKVNELNPAGAELFLDSESFINELESEDQLAVIGGALCIEGSAQWIYPSDSPLACPFGDK